jgi:hypothetical protein
MKAPEFIAANKQLIAADSEVNTAAHSSEEIKAVVDEFRRQAELLLVPTQEEVRMYISTVAPHMIFESLDKTSNPHREFIDRFVEASQPEWDVPKSGKDIVDGYIQLAENYAATFQTRLDSKVAAKQAILERYKPETPNEPSAEQPQEQSAE